MKRFLAFVGITILVFIGQHISQAQTPVTNNGTPPAIIFFASEDEAVTLEDLELNQAHVTVGWQVAQLRLPYTLQLEQYILHEWHSVLSESETLLATGEREVTLSHPVSFGEPMLRLRLIEGDSTIEEQIITFDYHVDEDMRPAIVVFDHNTPALDSNLVADGIARVYVWWEVSDRVPDTNLVFEQVLANGQVISVEEPRQTLWVPSVGMGNIRPVLDGDAVHLQMRVVNMRTDEVYDMSAVIIPVSQSPTVSGNANLTATTLPTSVSAGDNITFTVPTDPVNRLEPIHITWNVPNGANVTIRLLAYDLDISRWLPYFEGEWSNLPANGSHDVFIPNSIRLGTVRFRLESRQDGQAVQVDSDDIGLICYPIFHAEGCSTFAPQTTTAIYQAYENGTIIWREDINGFMVLYEYETTQRVGWREFSDTWTDDDADDFGLTPPAGLLAPTGRFGKLWTEHDDVSILGWATDPPQTYTMQYQTILGSAASLDAVHITLPDNAILNLFTASYDNGGPAWVAINKQ